MNFKEFLTRGGNRGLVLPKELQIFKKKNDEYYCKIDTDDPTKSFLSYKDESGNIVKYQIDEFLQTVVAKRDLMLKIHGSIANHFDNNNHFWDDLPLFLVRRHGSKSKKSGGGNKRRRGWVVRFNNAWIVYVDNFFNRHFFEASYYIDSINDNDIKELVFSLQMPFSSGGGEFEKKHRIFPSLSHISSSNNLYLSHLYDLNKGFYSIDNKLYKVSQELGRGEDTRFGCGVINDWDNGIEFLQTGKRFRIIDESLSEDSLKFLKANNIRSLSPLNYFPFPQNEYLKNGSNFGECDTVRASVLDFYIKTFGANEYKRFQQLAGVLGREFEDSIPTIKETGIDKREKKAGNKKNSHTKSTSSNLIEFKDTIDSNEFREKLLSKASPRFYWLSEIHIDGSKNLVRYSADKISNTSNMNNIILSKLQYRRAAREISKIVKFEVYLHQSNLSEKYKYSKYC